MKAKFIVAAATATVAFLAFDARADSASDAVPAKIQVNANGTIRFTLTGGVAMCASGGGSGGTGWGDIQVGQGGVTADGQKGMLSVLTSAKLAGKVVKVYASNGGAPQYGCLVTAIEMP